MTNTRPLTRPLVAGAAVVAIGVGAGVVADSSDAPACHVERLAVVVDLSDARSPETIRHAREAVAIAHAPRVLHVARDLAAAHRRASLRGIATAPGEDRDEYPPAFALEGGVGADVRLVPSADNRSAGATMGAALRPYCDGQAFVVEP